MKILRFSWLIFVGVGSGLVVGSGFIAFITVLDIIPRAMQMTHTTSFLKEYQMILIAGAIFGSLAPAAGLSISIPVIFIYIIGLFMGVYIGFLAAALTEVINVLPILGRRLNMQQHVAYLLTSLALGKMMGSLIHWLFPNIWQY